MTLWRRTWIPHRQAYMPRRWPQMAAVLLWSFGVGFPAQWLLGSTWWAVGLQVALTLAFGVGLAEIVWMRWRRRHPILTTQEYLRARANDAHLN